MIHRSAHDLRLNVWEGNLPSNTKGRWLLGCKLQVATLPAQTLPNYVADHGCSYGGTCCSFDSEKFLCMKGLTLSIYACYEQVTFVTEKFLTKMGVPMAISCWIVIAIPTDKRRYHSRIEKSYINGRTLGQYLLDRLCRADKRHDSRRIEES